MKTKIPCAIRRKKIQSVNVVPIIGTIEEPIELFKEQQTGCFEGAHYLWAMQAFIQLLERGVIPTGQKVYNFFDRYSCRVSVYNVPSYIQAHK